jgi:hypothetical protein
MTIAVGCLNIQRPSRRRDVARLVYSPAFEVSPEGVYGGRSHF